jgi:hypothetical protein
LKVYHVIAAFQGERNIHIPMHVKVWQAERNGVYVPPKVEEDKCRVQSMME